MHEFLGFWHYMFAPIGAAWYTAGVYGNQTQWTIVWLPTLIVLYRKKLECRTKGCWRLGHYPVENTHYKTCTRHTTQSSHSMLQLHHSLKHPHITKFFKTKEK